MEEGQTIQCPIREVTRGDKWKKDKQYNVQRNGRTNNTMSKRRRTNNIMSKEMEEGQTI